MLFARNSKHKRDRLPWREPHAVWSNQAGFDELYARLERVEELWPEAEYVMQDRLTGQHWLLTCNGRLGDNIAPHLNPISWPIVVRRHRETWLEHLIDDWRGPPWVRPRKVWQYDKHFQALRERLDIENDVNIRESLHRDRETGLLWRLCAVDGGGDMYPGTVNCFEPVTEQTEF